MPQSYATNVSRLILSLGRDVVVYYQRPHFCYFPTVSHHWFFFLVNAPGYTNKLLMFHTWNFFWLLFYQVFK